MVTGQQLVDLGKRRIGDKYVFGTMVPKNNPAWAGPWDCAEFVSWLIYQVSGKLYGCEIDSANAENADAFTGYFNRDAHSLGKIISISEASSTPGALVLRMSVSEIPGHIVVSDGKGGTVEAHSTKRGVIASTLSDRRWDCGILVPWIDYSKVPSQPVITPSGIVYRVTKPQLMKGAKIGEIQQALINAGFKPGTPDNVYGPKTARAVADFQEKQGLVVDGEVGRNTASALGVTL